jgi:hypothetical protein
MLSPDVPSPRSSLRTAQVLALAASAALVVACEHVEIEVSLPGYTPGDGSVLPKAYAVGQSVPFLATECDFPEAGGKYCGITSVSDPSHFTWSSDDPTIALPRSGGHVEMLRVGTTKIHVQSASTQESFFVKVVPAVASVSVSPSSVEIAVGELAWFTLTSRDAGGTVVDAVSVRTGLLQMLPLDLDVNYRNPIAGVSSSDDTRIALYGMRPGIVRVRAWAPVYGAHLLGDTVTVTVR